MRSYVFLWYNLREGESTEALPETYVIFITENDVLGKNLPLYPVEKYVIMGEEKVPFGDGAHILYVNGSYRGNNPLGKLMSDFFCSDPNQMHYEALAKPARYFKEESEGVGSMCKMLEDMRNKAAIEARAETAKNMVLEMLRNNIPLAMVAKIGKMTVDEVKALALSANIALVQ